MDWNPQTHYQDEGVAERYDAERFGRWTGRVFNNLEKSRLLEAFRDVPKSARVLDLPCGTGRLAEPLLEAGYSIVGVDISEQMLGIAHQRLSRFRGRFTSAVCDAHAISERKERFDAALCARVLMHFPLDEQIRFLRSVAAVTNGYVVFNQSLSTPYQRFRRKMKRLIGNPPPAAYPLTESDLQALISGAGLVEVRRIWYMPLVSEAAFIIARRA